jgi:hypothetical protein
MRHLIFILAAISTMAASCDYFNNRPNNQRSKIVSTSNHSDVHIFTITQLYSTDTVPPTDEAKRFVITGTIDKTDTDGGSFVDEGTHTEKLQRLPFKRLQG